MRKLTDWAHWPIDKPKRMTQQLLTLCNNEAVLFDPVWVKLKPHANPVHIKGISPVGKVGILAIDVDGNFLEIDRAADDQVGLILEAVKSAIVR